MGILLWELERSNFNLEEIGTFLNQNKISFFRLSYPIFDPTRQSEGLVLVENNRYGSDLENEIQNITSDDRYIKLS